MFRNIPGKITYKDSVNGTLTFEYFERVIEPTSYGERELILTYKYSGVVPREIVSKGTDVVKAYVEPLVNVEISRQKKEHFDRLAWEKDPNFPIEVMYEGVLLQGKIFAADASVLRVRLESPLTGETHVAFNMFSAMSGRYIFDKSGEFSSVAIKKAQDMLIGIYSKRKREMMSKNHEIVDDLNK